MERDSFKDRGLLILNIRSEEPNQALQAFLHKFSPNRLEIIPVGTFSMQEVSDLAYKMLGTQPSVYLSQRLTADTGGNALFLVESLRELSNRSTEELDQIERLPITHNMRSLVQDRVSLLSPNERIMVETAAVLGDEFKIEMLETCCEMSGIQVVQGLERLTHLNLAQPVAGLMPDRYRFSHQKTREIILGELSPARKRWLHHCVSRALEKIDFHPAQLAEHYTQAGEALKAFRQWVKATEYDMGVFAVHEAMEAFAQAEPFIAELTLSLKEDEINNFYTDWGLPASIAAWRKTPQQPLDGQRMERIINNRVVQVPAC